MTAPVHCITLEHPLRPFRKFFNADAGPFGDCQEAALAFPVAPD